MLSDLALKAQVMALDLSEMPAQQQLVALNRLRDQIGPDDATLLTATGKVLGRREP